MAAPDNLTILDISGKFVMVRSTANTFPNELMHLPEQSSQR